MKLTIGNNNFADIGTAVFYTQGDLDNRTYSKVQHKSNSSLLYERDFSEYNFSYEVEKDKFNDEFLVDYLGNKTLSLFEPSSNSLEKLEYIIFPTFGNEEWEGNDNKYFGTTLINNQVFVLLHAEKGIKRVELYNGFIYKNNDNPSPTASNFVSIDSLLSQGITPTEEPYFIIELGEPLGDEVVESTDLVRIKELSDEVEYEKMIWLLITSNNEVSEVNLSYKSWVDSDNPNRNMNKYLLRNDEFWSTKDLVRINDVVEDTDDNVVLDANSGTLLGTEKLDISRLLAFQKIKSRVDSCEYSDKGQGYPNYFPYMTYKTGDKVFYGGDIWESVADNNFNSNPALSTKWIRSSVMEDNRSINIIVKVIPEDGGYCNPMGVISLPSIYSVMRFKIYPGPGYELDTLQPCLLDDKDYIVFSNTNYDYLVPHDVVIVTDWRDVIKTGKLVFNLKELGSSITLSAEYEGEEFDYPNWGSAFNETNFTIYKMVEIDGEDSYTINDPYVNDSGELKVTTGKKIELYFKEFINYSISNVEMIYKESINSDPVTVYLTPEKLEDNECRITISKVNFTIATLKLILSDKQVTATIIEHSGFEISNNSIRTVSGNPVIFKFIDNEYETLSDGTKILADNLDRVILTDNQGNTLTVERFATPNVPMLFGYSSVYFSRIEQPIGSINYGEYTLRIDNIYFDTNIQILRKDDTK